MFRIKICGVTTPADALAAAAAGADAIGLNFFSGSPRCVDRTRAAEIVAALPAGVVKVGVFVNAAVEAVSDARDELKLDLVQLHGDEPPAFVAELGGTCVIRAFRLGTFGLGPLADYLDECRRLAALPRMVLVDAFQTESYGGTGQPVDWTLAEGYHKLSVAPPLILAGGLVAENVAEGIAAVRPVAVDTASGVEASPGRKDAAKLAAFVTAAQAAFARPCQGA